MKPGSIKNLRYNDAIASRRAHKKRVLNFFLSLCLLGVVGGLGYWIFWSNAFRVHAVHVEGLISVPESSIQSRIQEILSITLLSVVPTGSNILLFNDDPLKEQILEDFPEIKAVTIDRDYPHEITVRIHERTAIGTWCFKGVCRHFDDEGRVWGSATRSSGSLLVIVDDYKHEAADFIGPSLLTPIKAVAEGLEQQGLHFRYLVIPDNIFNDVWAVTNRGYTIYFNLEDSIEDQLATLKIFLDKKETESTTFQPQYLDLRIADRVYYK